MENFLLNTARIFGVLDFEYISQFLAAMPPMIVTVFLHGQGMRLASGCYRRFGPRAAGGTPRGPHVVLLIAIVAIMLATHFAEVMAWAIFYFETGMMADVKAAAYFSVNSYTTLGASNLTLEGRWKGLDGFEAMTAMLMFGWSTAMLATILQKSISLDD